MKGGPQAAEGEAPDRLPVEEPGEPGGLQRPVYDQAGIALDLADIVHVVMDTVAVAGQGGVAEQEHGVWIDFGRHALAGSEAVRHGGGGPRPGAPPPPPSGR